MMGELLHAHVIISFLLFAEISKMGLDSAPKQAVCLLRIDLL
jgi:hypothetical protein